MFRWRLINGTECKIREDLTNITCSTVVADKAREIGWEKTFVSLTKPVPQHQFTIIPMDIARDEDLEVCITVKVSQDAKVNPRNCTRIFGPYKPYIGSVTETKVKRPMLEFAEKTGHQKALLKIGEARTWTRLIDSPNMELLATELIEEKLQNIIMPEFVDDVDDLFRLVTSGNIGHRFLTDMEKPYAMVNSLPAFTTHFTQSSNNMASLSAGGRDHNIFYQEIYVTDMQILHIAGGTMGYLDDTYIAVPNCGTSLKDITDLKYDIDEGRLGEITPNPGVVHAEVGLAAIPEDIASQMEFVFGVELAQNIDTNFRIHHCNEVSGKLHGTHKESISLNDIRQLSITNILVISCLYSKHFRPVLAVENDYAISQSMDRSFTFIAEVIMNSGMLERVVNEIGMIVYEHTSMTQFEKLSPHLCRSMLSYIRQNAVRCISLCLAYTYGDGSLDQFWFYQKLVKNQNDRHLYLLKGWG